MNSKNIVFKTLHDLSKEDRTLFYCVLLNIWKQRNNKMWNEVIDTQFYIVERAKTMLHDWQDTQGFVIHLVYNRNKKEM